MQVDDVSSEASDPETARLERLRVHDPAARGDTRKETDEDEELEVTEKECHSYMDRAGMHKLP